MGEVYRARDSRLGREVAIKVLPAEVASDAERLSRFEQEALTASALNHPNIVTVYDVGAEGSVSYLAMELVEGRSLRELLASGPLSPNRVVTIGAQIAEGLAKAHAAGIVHRDLKPENLMVSTDGFVKILDFGLAKLEPPVPEGGESRAETIERRTAPGAVLGTAGYMSPEQASGRPVDFRSDQFALGAILYEMAAGTKAFQRPSPIETLTAVVREEPAPLSAVAPSVPEALSRVVERCLAKDPDERYHSTRDLARDLGGLAGRGAASEALPAAARRAPALAARIAVVVAVVVVAAAAAGWLALRRAIPAPAAEGKRSIAILPFQNFGGRAEDEYFSDGMTESLITDLARVKGLLVIARNSAFQYKGKEVDVRRVGEALHVRYVLEGSVQRSGDAVRVNAQLIDATTGYHVWAQKYDRPMKDVFALQDDLSGHIVGALKVALGRPGGSAAPTPTSNLEAYDTFLRGRYYLNQFDWVEKDKSIPLFERAIALDPGFAMAHAALGAAYAKKAFEGDPDGTWRAKTTTEIERALGLDPNLAQAYLARGGLAWTRENGFPHEKAAADFHRAIQLDPNLAAAHGALASLSYHVGLLDQALEEYRAALRIDPRNLEFLYRIPRIHLYQQRYAEALAEFEATPQFADDFLKPIAIERLGRHGEALRLAESHSMRNPTHSRDAETSDAASTLAVLLARAGNFGRAEEQIRIAIEKGRSGSHFHHASYNVATAYALLGHAKEAVDWLEKTAQWGMPCYPLFEKDPFLDSLRADPAFVALLSRMRVQWEGFRRTL